MYKVFFNSRIVLLASSFKKTLPKNSILYEVESISDIFSAWDAFRNNENAKRLYLKYIDVDALRTWFFSMFKIVEAAGGLVRNSNNELLCIVRWGKWDLPKGKIEKGESTECAATREVEEECGISGLKVAGLVDVTYHIYPNPKKNEDLILKPTYWYGMFYNGIEKLSPQTNEDIVEAKWLNETELKEARKNTYPSLKHLFRIT